MVQKHSVDIASCVLTEHLIVYFKTMIILKPQIIAVHQTMSILKPQIICGKEHGQVSKLNTI